MAARNDVNWDDDDIPKNITKLTFERLFEDHLKWTDDTFPKATCIGGFRHAERELKEIMDDLLSGAPKKNIATECGDFFGTILSAAHRSGIEPKDILNAMHDKLQVNKVRRWIDNGDGSYRHIK